MNKTCVAMQDFHILNHHTCVHTPTKTGRKSPPHFIILYHNFDCISSTLNVFTTQSELTVAHRE